MKRILGLDLGTTSIGWAYVIEDENFENSNIIQTGVRVNPLTVEEQTNFEKGSPYSVNQVRTLNRGARRNLDRYQDRRKELINTLKRENIINDTTFLAENGRNTTHSTWMLRAKAANERIELDELSRVFLAINKKRGYKSSRKAKNEDEGQVIDGMAIAKKLYEVNLTPGQFVFNMMQNGKRNIPDFYRSDLQAEFDSIWGMQEKFYPDILTSSLYQELKGKGQRATSAIFWHQHKISTADIKDIEESLKNELTVKLNLREKKKLQIYKWRSDAVVSQLELDQIATVITEVNNNINNSSGYLGAISDRSKELYFNNQTVGEYLYAQLKTNLHTSLRNQVFYRQDYLDEFEKIWETQSQYHSVLTNDLKSEIRDTIIFYQRKLKSQKGLISFCELESRIKEIEKDGVKTKKTIGARVAPRSSPLFQEFKIWQNLNNVLIRDKGSRKRTASNDNKVFYLSQEEKQFLFDELNIKGNLSASAVLDLLGYDKKAYEINYTHLEGNHTNKTLFDAYFKILELEGYSVKNYLNVKSNKDDVELADVKVTVDKIIEMVETIFNDLGIDAKILNFNSELENPDLEKQSHYQLWHLLYSYEEDDSMSGNEKLYELLKRKFGFKAEHAQILGNVAFLDDYGNLSTKAIRRIFPFIKENMYSVACELAGYKHSKHSLTKEELEGRVLKPRLELLKKNSLRQPVVEKILNQMVNVVNTLIDKENDKLEAEGESRSFHFDEIRIELARELKRNAKERDEMTKNINAAKIKHEKIYRILQSEFGLHNPTRNDIVKYRLYEELKNNGYKDLYTDTYIPRDLLFSKQIDIEHIIPQSRMFDDSFSNKTVVYRKDNLEKGSLTAYDYIEGKFGENGLKDYESRLEKLYKLGQENQDEGISKAKYYKLLKREDELGDGFIERDLRTSQYIAKMAKDMLYEITNNVVSTTGQVTDRLREDWGLINVMKELNLPKYRALGLTEMEERKFGQRVEVIKDWTKRNDHRHHAMDALTIAFTKHSHIQYLNYLNARKNEKHKLHGIISAIEEKETVVLKDDNGSNKRVFKEPIPNFRQVAKEHLESVIVSHKAKNKVVTRNKNRIAGKQRPQITLTPRGQLHKETVYGKYQVYESKWEKIGSKFDIDTIRKVSNPGYRKVLLERLKEYGNDPKKAFTGNNSLKKNPIYLDNDKTLSLPESVKLVWLIDDYSTRKEVNPDNFKNEKSIEKVIDEKIKSLLKERLAEFGGDVKKAFSDLDKNPIWFNRNKGIAVKRVKISGVKNAEALHSKKDHLGNYILDEDGNHLATSFVSTGNNHHVAIYQDEKGNLQEYVVSFFEATARVSQGLPIVDRDFNKHLGWKFLFTMKQNELFVFPNEKTGFNPSEIDLLDPMNKKVISLNLFRVQKFTIKDYFFRHHLETNVDNLSDTRNTLWKREGVVGITGIIKVRTNHLGDIVGVGEY